MNSSPSLVEKYFNDINYLNHTSADDDVNAVYCIRNESTGFCKIGCSRTPKRRIRQIESTSGFLLQTLLILYLQTGYDETPEFVERYIHDFFKDKREKGEWFNLDIDDIMQIRDLFWKIEGEDIMDDIDLYFLMEETNENNY